MQIFDVVDEKALEENPQLYSQVQGVVSNQGLWQYFRDALPNMDSLKIISCLGTGVDILYSNTPGAATESIANVAMTLILNSSRGFIKGITFLS